MNFLNFQPIKWEILILKNSKKKKKYGKNYSRIIFEKVLFTPKFEHTLTENFPSFHTMNNEKSPLYSSKLSNFSNSSAFR